MELSDLEKLLKNTDDRLSVFTDKEKLKNYNFILSSQLADLINNCLTKEEKFQLLQDEGFISNDILNNYDFNTIISSLSDNLKIELLTNPELILDKFHLSTYQVKELSVTLPNEREDLKDEIIETYDFSDSEKLDILCSYSDGSKIDILLNDNEYDAYEKTKILSSFDAVSLATFITTHQDFLKENNIKLYDVTKYLKANNQIDFIKLMDQTNLTLSEKKEILATLRPEAKKDIDRTNLPQEYTSALDFQCDITSLGPKMYVDIDGDLEKYRGLDDLLVINPKNFTEQQRDKLFQFHEICPNTSIVSSDNDYLIASTFDEYIQAEEWIDSNVLSKIKPEYTDVQKTAIIDNELGKHLYYSPDEGTENFDGEASRALWKIISSGYGVCNGIAEVEQYVLNKVGIESEIISGKRHAFLKLIDVELPSENGELIKGNTILDPTWNLSCHRFNASPSNFCVDYKTIRQHDIDENGNDHLCHKNDEKLQDATLKLDTNTLKKVFASVGVAKQNGEFHIQDLFTATEAIDERYSDQPEKNIQEQFSLLARTCPDFAICQSETTDALRNIFLSNRNLHFDECIINRVFDKNAKDKNPVLYTYITSEELGEKFYIADKEQGQFLDIPKEDFIKRFECYDMDLAESKRS